MELILPTKLNSMFKNKHIKVLDDFDIKSIIEKINFS